jgi:Big-like domain-containing protein
MPSVQDCGRAFARARWPRLARRLFTRSAISLFALASTFAACNDSPSPPTAPRDAALAGGDVTVHAASVAYPIVTIQPTVTTIAVGAKVTLRAKLSEGSASWMGKKTTWRSSDTTILSVAIANWGGAGGDEGIFTGKKAGKATITATTESQTVGSMAVTVTSTSSGSTPPPPTTPAPAPAPAPAPTPPILAGTTHQPSGYIAVVNTGPLTSGPTGHNTSWTSGGPIPMTWTLVQGTPAANMGLSSAASTEPQSEGYRIYFPAGAQNDAAVAASLPFTPVGGGSIYARWRMRLGSTWSTSAMNAQSSKLFAPKDVNSANDDIVMAYLPSPVNYAAGVGLQGPTTANVPNNNVATPASTDMYAAGVWNQIEVLITADSPAGAGNGTVTVWVNGVQGAKTTGVSIFSSSEKMQWRNWSIYAARAVYSGVQAKTTFEDIDNLYVAVSPN